VGQVGQTFSWNGLPVAMLIPERQQLDAWAAHLRVVAADLVDQGLWDGGGDETDVEISVDVEQFAHAVWWLDPADCPGPGSDLTGSHQCVCGPLTLLAVLEGLGDADRSLAVTEYRGEMTRAFDHFWSGDSALADSDSMGSACPGCLIDGVAHVAQVGAEAESLAVELGYALAAFHHELTLGSARHEALRDGTP
jgi:hypothetical protein